MENSLLKIEPHRISRNLADYSFFIFGEPKTGKTTVASHFPKPLLLAFEKGYNAIPGVYAKDIYSWVDFRKTLLELQDPKVKEMFQTIIIDTADIAVKYCDKYVCNKESTEDKRYDTVAEIPYGVGYKKLEDEFDLCLRKIINLNYGLVVISHSVVKTFKDTNEKEYNKIVPTLDNKAKLVCSRTCDIIGFTTPHTEEDGSNSVRMYLRGNTRLESAGSRFKFMDSSIIFSYPNLKQAFIEAIERQEAESGTEMFVDNVENETEQEYVYDFEKLKDEFNDLVAIMMSKDPNNAVKIEKIVDKYLGKGRKVSECTRDQAALLDLVVFDLKREQ